MSRRWVVGALILQAVVVVLVFADVLPTLRAVSALLWALLVPGYALAVHLRLDSATRGALSVATSLALALLVAQSLVWLDLYSLEAAMLVVAAIATVGLVASLRVGPLPQPLPATPPSPSPISSSPFSAQIRGFSPPPPFVPQPPPQQPPPFVPQPPPQQPPPFVPQPPPQQPPPFVPQQQPPPFVPQQQPPPSDPPPPPPQQQPDQTPPPFTQAPPPMPPPPPRDGR